MYISSFLFKSVSSISKRIICSRIQRYQTTYARQNVPMYMFQNIPKYMSSKMFISSSKFSIFLNFLLEKYTILVLKYAFRTKNVTILTRKWSVWTENWSISPRKCMTWTRDPRTASCGDRPVRIGPRFSKFLLVLVRSGPRFGIFSWSWSGPVLGFENFLGPPIGFGPWIPDVNKKSGFQINLSKYDLKWA